MPVLRIPPAHVVEHGAESVVRSGAGDDFPQPLQLFGELDMATADELALQVREYAASTGGSVVVLDLSAVSFMDSSGLDPLLRAHASLASQDRLLFLRSPGPAVLRLLRILDSLGTIPLVRQTLAGARPTDEARDALGLRGVQDLALRLREELRGQAVLEQAKGVLMWLHTCDAEQAGLLLELIGRRHAVGCGDLAAGLVTGLNHPGFAPPLGDDVQDAVRAALGSAARPTSLTER
jgi:anti-anti-sigma factor